MEKVKGLFVCMGNICRSPTAEGVFRKVVEEAGLSEQILVDSAGTHAYHAMNGGSPPDERAQAVARRRGVDLSGLRARVVEAADFEKFHYIIAMDEDNRANLEALCPSRLHERIFLFMEFAPDWGMKEVPDPYYGGSIGFEAVFDMVEAASQGLLNYLCERHFKEYLKSPSMDFS